MAAVQRELVKEGIGRRVVAHAHGAEEGGRGGEQDEGFQLVVQREPVQVPGALRLGGEDPFEARRIEAEEPVVIQRPGQVPDALQRRHVFQGGVHGMSQGAAVGHVGQGQTDSATLLPQVFQQGRFLRRGLAAGQQQQVTAAPA